MESSIIQVNQILSKNLSKAIVVGVNGSSLEQPLHTLLLALSEPLISHENKGFLRDDAFLQIVFITDTDDQSNLKVDDVEKYLRDIKNGYEIFASGGIVPSVNPLNCKGENQDEKPFRLEQFINDFKGQILSLCSPTFAQDLKIYENALLEFDRSVALPSKPKFNSIKVQFGQTNLIAGDLLNGWIFDSLANKVTIGSKFDFLSAPAGTKLRLEYVPLDWQ